MGNQLSAVVLDHDGTLTDSEKGYAEYLALAANFLAHKIGKSVDEIQVLFSKYARKILTHPEGYGWEIDGRIVSPPSDQYLVVQVILEIMFGKHAAEYQAEVFEHCYPLTDTYYRQNAAETLIKLMDKGDVYIVTNSSTDKVSAKLHTVLREQELSRLHLVGNAKKMQVDESWVGVVPPGSYHGFSGFPKRGVYLQRHNYYDTLNSIFHGDFSHALVIGDIGEMDLALVDYLGGKTTLIANSLTPSWELSYWGSDKSRNRHLIHDLSSIVI